MPVKEFSKSMKAKMYDFTYTPFMSSMVIAWIILNHKYILIYMSSAKLDEKLNHLKAYDFSLWDIPYTNNIILAIVFGLFYTYAYPIISKKFYQYTLNRTKELKTIKKDIEDKTPITEEEAKEYREQFILMSAEIQELRAQLSDANKLVLEKSTDKILTKEELQKKFSKNIPDKETKTSITEEDDKTKILRYFYESNYRTSQKENLLSEIVNSTKIPRPKVQKILNTLILEDNILSESTDDYKFIDITLNGNDKLIELFDKE